jgi:hypothetical protein
MRKESERKEKLLRINETKQNINNHQSKEKRSLFFFVRKKRTKRE